MTDHEIIALLLDALTEAQSHLDYCGYGDNWERECADAKKLPKQIDDAVEAGNSHVAAWKKVAP